MQDARRRKVDVVICWRFDRFARSTKHLTERVRRVPIARNRLRQPPRGDRHDLANGQAALHDRCRDGGDAAADTHRAGSCRHGQRKEQGQGTRLPKKVFRRNVAVEMRAAGLSWRKIANALGIPASTIRGKGRETGAEKRRRKKLKSSPRDIAETIPGSS